MDRPRTRLYVEEPLSAGTVIALSDTQSHFLIHVLRAREGECVALFNGRDGEWLARIDAVGKRRVEVALLEQTRPLHSSPDAWLLFAPIKNEKIDFLVQRATELGVSRLVPVLTERTIVRRVNIERLGANVIEAAEQCGRTDIPRVEDLTPLADILGAWQAARPLYWGDESGGGHVLREFLPAQQIGPFAALVGPEGGFSPAEHHMIRRLPFAHAVSMGPRILRAETAALALLANLQAWIGDWHEPPRFIANG